MKKLIKFFLFFVLGTVILVTVLTFFTQTPIFKNWLKNRIVAAVQSSINGTLEVRSLQGNLWTSLQIDGVSLKSDGKTLAHIERGFIKFNLFSLFEKKIEMRECRIENPVFRLSQSDAGLWNFQQIFKTEVSEEYGESPDSASFEWQIEAPRIHISSGQAEIGRLKDALRHIPRRIRDVNVQLGFRFMDNKMSLSLQNLNFVTEEPALVFRTVRTDVQVEQDVLSATRVEIETGASRLSSSFDLQNFDNPIVHFFMKGAPVSFDEIKRAVPLLELYGNPQMTLAVDGPLHNLKISSHIAIAEARIDINGQMQAQQPPYEYTFAGTVARLNLEDLTQENSLRSDINFDFEIDGRGLSRQERISRIIVDFDSSVVFGRSVENAHVECDLRGESLQFKTILFVEGASSKLTGFLKTGDLKKNVVVAADVRNLNLSRFFESPALASDLNGALSLSGEWQQPDNLIANIEMNVLPSFLQGVPIDTAFLRLNIRDHIFHLQRFGASSPLCELTAAGQVSIRKENDFKLEVDFTDFSMLSAFFPDDTLYGQGRVLSQVSGPADSLVFQVDLALENTGMQDINVAGLNAQVKALVSDSTRYFHLRGEAANMTAFGVDSLTSRFKVTHKDSSAVYDVQINRGEHFETESRGRIQYRSQATDLSVEYLQVRYLEQQWEKPHRESRIRFSDRGIDIHGLELTFQDQRISLSGRFDSRAESDMRVQVQGIDITKYQNYFAQDADFKGLFDLDIRYRGTFDSPHIQADVKLTHGQYLQVPFESFSGNFEVTDNRFSWRCILSRTAQDSLFGSSGFLPLNVSMDPFQFEVLQDSPLLLKFNARGLDVSILQLFSNNVRNVKGVLVADVVLNKSLNDLHGVGPIRLFDGEFEVPSLGTWYKKINVALILKEKEVVIRDFRVRSGKGDLKIVQGGLSLSEKSLKDFNARFKANDFLFINNKQIQATVKGDVDLSGSVQAPYFSGNLMVTECRIFYTDLIQEETVELSRKPFFVVSDAATQNDSTGALRFQKTGVEPESQLTEMPFYRNLRGELAVDFPRNTWVKSKDTNIEVGGKLVVVKEDEDFLLFGSLAVLRGHYKLLGKRFQVSKGELLFYGEPEPNPEIDIEASYEFRDSSGDDREKHEFKVFITGTFYSPQFKFTLDDQVAEQEDILSILIFGQSSESLSFGQRNSVSGGGGLDEQARGFVTGQLMQALTGRLGQELQLDVVQFESGKNLEDTRLRIGKYVTPDVFVSISQDFGEEGNQKVELEYEIPKIWFFNLLLQASQERKGDSGMDVIWKIEW
ncbi:MAG: translocation/assembly module TamB domain-containing protein [bacterium]